MIRLRKFYALILISLMTACLATPVFKLSSPAITGGPETGYYSKLKSAGRIEEVYAARDNQPLNRRSFPFTWRGVPAGTKVLAVILDDPDAKPVMESRGIKGDAFIHWLAADIDPSSGGLFDNASLKTGSFAQGVNGGGSTGYVGPRPPSDFPENVKKPIIHIYRLTVYALSAPTGLKEGFTRAALEEAMKGKVLGKAELFFSYNN